MRILTFLGAFFVFMAMTGSMFWSVYKMGRKYDDKPGGDQPDPPADGKKDTPKDGGNP